MDLALRYLLQQIFIRLNYVSNGRCKEMVYYDLINFFSRKGYKLQKISVYV